MLKKYQLLTTLLWLGVTVVGWIFVLFIAPGYGSAWWWLSFLVLPICEEVVLLMRRRGQFNPYVDTTQLLKISRSRLTWRIVIVLVIIIFSLFLGRSHNVVIGIYIGFVTNALVSMFILNVAIPELQARIASTIGSNMSNFVDTDSSDEAGAGAGAGVGVGLGTILGLFLRVGIATTALTGLLGMLGGHKAGEKVGEMAGERIKKGVEENIRSGVENLSPKEMCDFIDSIIGAILIAIEVLGAFFGVLFVWLF